MKTVRKVCKNLDMIKTLGNARTGTIGSRSSDDRRDNKGMHNSITFYSGPYQGESENALDAMTVVLVPRQQ
jgi:hypothetical protein